MSALIALMRTFYRAPVSLKFWAWGLAYTIVRFRHIGIDLAVTGAARALRRGRVTRVVQTSTMNWVVEVKWGPLYISYCHLATTGRLPRVGDEISAGEILGDIATSSNPRSQWYGGSAWRGRHLHLVVSNKSGAAFTYPKIRGARFFDPAPLIRDTVFPPAPLRKQVATRDTRMFATPSKAAPGVGTLAKSTVVTTLGPALGGFERIQHSSGEIVYVLATRLLYRDRTVNTPGSSLNYRSHPTTARTFKGERVQVLGSLEHGTKVRVVGAYGAKATDSATWVVLEVDGRKVYASRKFLR